MKKFLRILGAILIIIVFQVVAFVAYLTVDEYKPDDVEGLTIQGKGKKVARIGEELTFLSWNIGYGALGDNADFFMDGGKMVNTASKERVQENLNGIASVIDEIGPDVLLMQEVDLYSTRSYFINELEALDTGSESVLDYITIYATNYKVAYVPLPLPPIGKVDAGVATASELEIANAQRYKLPNPFKWPLRTINLKRCLEVMRAPVEGSDKELVIVNVHLDAYDSGEGKIAQTKMLKDFLDNENDKGNYVIVGGDFNQVFSNADVSRYPRLDVAWQPGNIDVTEFGDKVTFVTDTSAPTTRSLDKPLDTAPRKEPEFFQYYVTDGYIVSSNISVNTVQTLNLGFKCSDHNPVVLKLVLN